MSFHVSLLIGWGFRKKMSAVFDFTVLLTGLSVFSRLEMADLKSQR